MLESIGRRIAALRHKYGWTQQALANRLSISRVAISHIEMDLTFPGERTVVLLAGLFKISPYELVEGTTYPQAKLERLPAVACCYTALEMDLALMENDLTWLARFKGAKDWDKIALEIREKWLVRLSNRSKESIEERDVIEYARQKLNEKII
jgi:transcriptional regulator with XRE-family HTH domain